MTTAETRPPWPRGGRWPVVALAILAAATVCVGVLLAGGALEVEALPGLPVPSTAATWLVPVLRLVTDLASASTVGLLLAAAFFVAGRDGAIGVHAYRWLRAASWSAATWCAASVASVPVVLADFLGVGPRQVSARAVVRFAIDLPQGRALLVVAVLAAAVAIGARVVLSLTGAAVLMVVAVVGLLPPTLTGHTASAGSHQAAVSSLLVHVVAVTLWSGGLLALVLARRLPPTGLAVAAGRYSRMAGWCLAAVAGSGLLNAATRLRLGEITSTSYGRLVLAKTAALAVLAGFGWWQRRRTLPALATGAPRAFGRLAQVEVVVFAATIGLAVGLSRTPTPAQGGTEDLAQSLLGYSMPGPISVARLLTPYPDVFFPLLAAVAIGLYLAGVRRLARNGVRWPPGRTVAWILGWLLVLAVTASGLAWYGTVLASVHMIQHMTLSMAAPVLLVLAGPITLALRALRPSPDPELRGPREWLRLALGSRVVRLLSHPLVALAIYVVSLYGTYYTGLYELSLRSHAAHLVLFVHFLASGALLFWVLVGIDPSPHRMPYPAKVLLLFLWLAFHTVFGIVMIQSSTLLAPDWFTLLPRPWGPDPLADQKVGGGIAWGFGDLPIVGIVAALVVQWIRADEREQRRIARAAARAAAAGRPQDDPHEQYNAYLRRLHEADQARTDRAPG